MKKRVNHIRAALIAAGLLSCGGLYSLSASAMRFGEPVTHSYLGQALRVVIPVHADSDELLESKCFTLGRPENQGYDVSYLTQARMAVDENGMLKIQTLHAINDPFVRLFVQVDCGQGRVGREFVLLLDPVEQASKLSTVFAPVVPVTPVSLPPTPQDRVVKKVRKGDSHVPDRHSPRQSDSGASKKQREPVEQISPPAPARDGAEFRLQLSTGSLDLSLLGKMTEEQLLHLREKQLLLDADDQVANNLSMKNRIMQLEGQLVAMQKAVDETNRQISLFGTKPALPQGQRPEPKPRENDRFRLDFNLFYGIALVVAVAILALWLRWRKRMADALLEGDMEPEFSEHVLSGESSLSATIPELRDPIVEPSPTALSEDENIFHDVSSIFSKEDESVIFTEAESVLEEADLYLAYGWANRAIELLQKYLENYPADVQLWQKLFETYHSQGMKQEFEQLALRCQATMNDKALWVQARHMGRQLDAENSLYFTFQDEEEAPVIAPIAEEVAPQSLEFVLDADAEAVSPEDLSAHENTNHLGLDPLFPEMFETDEPTSGQIDGGKSSDKV